VRQDGFARLSNDNSITAVCFAQKERSGDLTRAVFDMADLAGLSVNQPRASIMRRRIGRLTAIGAEREENHQTHSGERDYARKGRS